MWFDAKDISVFPSIRDPRLHGYVLPHASTTYSGHIIGHTLRFAPTKKFTNVVVMYYPAGNEPDIEGKYYHELYVPALSIQFMIRKVWKIKREIKYKAINVRDTTFNILNYKLDETLFIISADFSHFLPLNKAVEVENCAATALSFKDFSLSCLKHVDTLQTFLYFNNSYPYLNFDWIGRTRSSGTKGVGYATFLIHSPIDSVQNPYGFFVTVYDKNMRARECLGRWTWSQKEEKSLIATSIESAATTSRLTGGEFLHVPLKWYSVSYLYETPEKQFIRGVHGILKEAFYLPQVFLEHVYDNGVWMKDSHTEWPLDRKFDMSETLEHLQSKGGYASKKPYKLYVAKYKYSRIE